MVNNQLQHTDILDDYDLSFGTDRDIRCRYDEATDDRLEITDGTNVLAYLKDLGTTGLFGVTGHIECPQIGISADTDLIGLASGALSVNGTLDVLGHICAGGAASIDSLITASFNESYTTTSSSTTIGTYSRVAASPAATSSGAWIAQHALIIPATAQTFSSSMNAVRAEINPTAAATIAAAYGCNVFVRKQAGTITDYRAVNSGVVSTGTTITTGYGIYLDELGAATAEYGLYIADLNNATTNYAIYTNAGTVRFGGRVIIADTASPASNATGTAGMITWDANYIYVCTATNTWERAALTGGY